MVVGESEILGALATSMLRWRRDKWSSPSLRLPFPAASPLPVITSGSNKRVYKVDSRVGSIGIYSKPIDKNVLRKYLLNFTAETWHYIYTADAMNCGSTVSFPSNRRYGAAIQKSATTRAGTVCPVPSKQA
jgi:hypothetical protein